MTDSWSLAITGSQQELQVVDVLTAENFSFHWFREQYRTVRRAQLLTLVRPLFPRYIFVQAQQAWHYLQERTKIIGFVRFGGEIATVADGVVEGLCAAAGPTGILPAVDPHHVGRFSRGDRVVIGGAGAFSGKEAVFQREIDGECVLVFVDLFGRIVPVSMRESDLSLERWRPRVGDKPKRKHRRQRSRGLATYTSPPICG